MNIIGLLMKEHRLIEKMVQIMQAELQKINTNNVVDTEFIKSAVDFFHVYADECHHGKEEDILFRALEKKPMADNHRNTMQRLIKEHEEARGYIKELRLGSITQIKDSLQKIVDLYPHHIDTEDNHFFKEVINYFSEQEKLTMRDKGLQTDRMMIHKKYKDLVAAYLDEAA